MSERCKDTFVCKAFTRPARCRKHAGHEGEHECRVGGGFVAAWDSEPEPPTTDPTGDTQ